MHCCAYTCVLAGNFDLICNHVGTTAYLQALEWPGAAAFRASSRRVWARAHAALHDGRPFELYGWARSAGNLTQLVVANAGHMAPADSPDACLDMLTRFLSDVPF